MLRDLSHPIRDGMMVYPGDPPVTLSAALTMAVDGVRVTRIHMGSHTGTHVDAPAHTVPGGRTLAQVALEELVGEALLIRVPGLTDGEQYGWDAVTAGQNIPEVVPPIVIIDVGWAQWFGTERALRHPSLDPAAARELAARGMRVLAVDTVSPDPTDDSEGSFPVHQTILGGDGLIIENVCGLDGLPSRFRVGFFPLKLDGDAAPVRGLAFLE